MQFRFQREVYNYASYLLVGIWISRMFFVIVNVIRNASDRCGIYKEGEFLDEVPGLAGDRDFQKALAEICRNRLTSFTLRSLCSCCGIQGRKRY